MTFSYQFCGLLRKKVFISILTYEVRTNICKYCENYHNIMSCYSKVGVTALGFFHKTNDDFFFSKALPMQGIS